mgnify:CR=1 FL=1
MNQRKAKEFRRAAEQLNQNGTSYVEIETAKYHAYRDADGKSQIGKRTTTELNPDCTRAIYKTIKREYKNQRA